jgi:tetratricopeptide (TPR) repeat protein
MEIQGTLSERSTMDDRDAIAAMVSDLYWQIDQMAPRGVKDSSGNPYNPAYYKRGLQNAIGRGGLAVVDYVRSYLYKAPSDGYKKLQNADSLDLACEALVADEDKPYAHLFTEADRSAARARLAPHIKAIEARKAARQGRIDARRASLPGDLEALNELAAQADGPEEVIAINMAILDQAPADTVALNRLGRGYEAMGRFDLAAESFRKAVAADPTNAIAARRLRDLERRQVR